MSTPLELWGGAECTVNRLGDGYRDQIELTGHDTRLHDMERLADLGVRRVRFPVLWERVAPKGLARASFAWTDLRLRRLRELGIVPIVGLVHHGSGPRYAPIQSDAFVSELAAFARMVAERYPWIDAYTPINEPLTTARFCGLYGHWYPHGRSTATFLHLLLNEVRATRAAMNAVRAVNPTAQLVQTEDVGRCFGTTLLRDQCDYENHRRWLSLDLLTGRVDAHHPLHEHLMAHGITARELDDLVEHPCTPDVLGFNYYLTSDRFLDERLDRYPTHTHGGNGRLRYADVEAVRVYGPGIYGHAAVLREAFERYRRPVALTEVHLGCTQDEQLRWLYEAWQAATQTRALGIDVRAITLWAVFGSVDWCSLLTRHDGHYEPGVYDVRSGMPVPTDLVALAKQLADNRAPHHPAMVSEGWWRRHSRFCYPVHGKVA